MHPNDIRLVFYLPNLNSYRDRAHLIGQIANRIGKAVLVTSKLDMEPEEIGIDSKLEVVELPRGVRFPGRTAFAASRVVEDLVKNYHINIVHDTFSHLLPLFFRRHRFPGCIFITSQYILSEWDFRHFIWPRYRIHSVKYRDLRLWMLRIPLQRMIFSLADCIVVQAPGLIDRLVQHIPVHRTKIECLPNSISGSFKDRRANSNLKKDDHIIKLLIVGGFGVGKGANTLLDLLGRARMRNIPIEATAVGGFAAIDEGYLRHRISRLDLGKALTVKGRVGKDSLNELYDSSDWLYHMSDIDGSPRVVLEALSRGIPVIGSFHPGIKVLDPDQRFILFAEPRRTDSLLDELVASKNDPQRYAARRALGQSYVQTHFSSEAVSKRYVDLYIRLLQERSDAQVDIHKKRGLLVSNFSE